MNQTLKVISLPCILLFVLIVGGCGQTTYILAVKHVQNETRNTPPDVIQTDSYRKVLPEVKTIAYRPPDICQKVESAQITGKATATQQVLVTTCGVWLSEFERAFSSRGYQVVSWQSLTSNMDGTQQGDLALERAQQLGVDILFLINSFTVDKIDFPLKYQSRIELFYSNRDKQPLKPFPLNNTYEINKILNKLPEDSIHDKELSATVDMAAIHVKTKQTVWFYRHTLIMDKETQSTWKGLFRCQNGYCSAYDFPRKNASQKTKPVIQNDAIVINYENPKELANPLQKRIFGLVRKSLTILTENFVANQAQDEEKSTSENEVLSSSEEVVLPTSPEEDDQ